MKNLKVKLLAFVLSATVICSVLPFSPITVKAADPIYPVPGENYSGEPATEWMIGDEININPQVYVWGNYFIKGIDSDHNAIVGELPNNVVVPEPTLVTETDEAGNTLYYWEFTSLGVKLRAPDGDQVPTGLRCKRQQTRVYKPDGSGLYSGLYELELTGIDYSGLGDMHFIIFDHTDYHVETGVPEYTKFYYAGDHVYHEFPRISYYGGDTNQPRYFELWRCCMTSFTGYGTAIDGNPYVYMPIVDITMPDCNLDIEPYISASAASEPSLIKMENGKIYRQHYDYTTYTYDPDTGTYTYDYDFRQIYWNQVLYYDNEYAWTLDHNNSIFRAFHIVAEDRSADGGIFKEWVCSHDADIINLQDPYSPETSFLNFNGTYYQDTSHHIDDVTITATYGKTGNYTVVNGAMYEYDATNNTLGNEKYTSYNEDLAIVAPDEDINGNDFLYWTCDKADIVLDDPTNPTAHFTSVLRSFDDANDQNITFTAVYENTNPPAPPVNPAPTSNDKPSSTSNTSKPQSQTVTFSLPELDFNDVYWFDPYNEMYDKAVAAGKDIVEWQGDFGLPGWFMEKVAKNNTTIHYTVVYTSKRYKDFHHNDTTGYKIYDIYITPEKVQQIGATKEVLWYGPEYLGVFYGGKIVDEGDKPFEEGQTVTFNTMG